MRKIFKGLFSIESAIVLGIIFILIQAKATFLPSENLAWEEIYGRIWFDAVMWLLGINLVGVMIRYKTYRKWPVFILHLSLIIMLIGAGATRYFGYQGIMHIRQGQSTSTILLENKANPSERKTLNLGFKIKLDRFIMNMYPGSRQPSSYKSYVEVIDHNTHFKYCIHMNHILQYRGYRFYQMSYDPDGKGTILSVSHDEAGMWISYLGYFLLGMGFFASMFYKKSRFRMTVRELKKSGLFVAPLFLLFSINGHTMTLKEWSIKSKQVAKIWSGIMVESNGRIEPMDTLDLNYIHKITRKSGIMGMNYNQIIVGMIAYPNRFKSIPMIYIGHPKIDKMLGIKGKYASYKELFGSDGTYKLSFSTTMAMRTPPDERTTLDRELLKLSERVYAAYMIYTASAFRIFPPMNSAGKNSVWYSPPQLFYKMGHPTALMYYDTFKRLVHGLKTCNTQETKKEASLIQRFQRTYSPSIVPSSTKIKMEVLYNHLSIFPRLIPVYLLIGILTIILGFIEIFSQKRFRGLEKAIILIGAIAFLLHTGNMGLRWYIASHAPWSDAYESIVFIAWGSAFASLFFFRKSMLALGSGLFMAGVFMFVAHLNNIDPQITNVVPVLKSYWLVFHVAFSISSYGFLGVGAMLAFLNLILLAVRDKTNVDSQIHQIANIIFLSLYIGLALLTIGTFLGAVWANQSWGSYWSWDPKETWSLIMIIVYAIVIHTRFIPSLKDDYTFSLLSFLSIYSMIMTYFGVNFYIAQGLHSYGQAEGALGSAAGMFGILDAILSLNTDKFIWAISITPIWVWISCTIVLFIIWLGYKNNKKAIAKNRAAG